MIPRHPAPARSVAAALVTAILAGCATQASTRSGFLGDYSRLRPQGDAADPLAARMTVQAAAPGALDRYRAVLVDPVSVTAAGLDPEQRAALAAVLTRALAQEIGKGWPLATAPGPGVLRVRAAVTAVTKANVPLNVAMTLVATAVANGGAAGEAEIVDASSGRRVAALTFADERRFSEMLGMYQETGHAEAVLPDFAAAVARTIAR